METLQDFLKEYKELLALDNSISLPEAERRAAKFLVGMATITDLRHTFSNEKVKLLTVQTATFAEEMSKSDAKTVTENKMRAEASSAYVVAREDLERIENDIAFLKAYYDILNNGHVFYRNIAKGEAF